GVREAFVRSSRLVAGRTGAVLALVVVANVVTSAAAGLVTAAFGFLPAFLAIWLGGTVAGALTVPFEAHVLTVLYYRLTEPERPVLPDGPRGERRSSLGDGEPSAYTARRGGRRDRRGRHIRRADRPARPRRGGAGGTPH